MKYLSSIHHSIAAFLVLVLMVGTAPKNLYHRLFADHKDQVSCTHPASTPHHIHKQSINCHFDDVVINMPYVADAIQVAIRPLLPVNVYNTTFSPSKQQWTWKKVGSRGPPMM